MFMKSDSDIYIQVAEKKCGLIAEYPAISKLYP